ncbi:AAA family ATPase [Eubacterium ventriosum]|uniref:AAA family ATPase n=1 Tax=Eubacterium ventriosum TaxID=39496 RepID=UPI001C02BEEC|nr:MoxR family ATPase [Eubacterium ventriosum]MBT9693049.1 AAA domain-containing protein [Eubacterium ventriosum]MBT9697399.1 AAA domain-containing protein [Eubacterium ventriosum]
MNNYLQKLNINENLKKEINLYRESYPVSKELLYRIPKPDNLYYGDEIWNQAVTALLCGENILLVGHKATGKNIFAENLAAAFGRPKWDISFHVNMDAASLIGMDTFRNGEVTFRPGPVYSAAKSGGFAILDEINMAKSEAMAVLHATLDFRRTIDVPGYDRIDLHPATRFIATMNYGYSGTKELNEALVSRFAVIKMPMISKDNLIKLIQDKFETISEQAAEEFANVFLDLQKKCENSEISSKALDIRGLLDSIALMEKGLEVHTALDMGITNKSFDMYEQTLIKDTIGARISKKIKTEDLFKK